ncbi:post-segregation antitoxin CcdA [Salmonella enterica subsp. enterica serovar Enteritidis]|nr:post-segregation antitoxin CcdA [Salmonella enterica subsp. enterica]EBU8132067.1 post-segregation antitoxin CcdA [Salmonella enterica subsp. enterica serovar Java]EBW2250143.1 post-segregation antitoxin CcdA [Salmonella enterica subsp. enterica serovar Enteritidis]EBX4816997.1 post-segregation antitoxin CcdA [Salmonella enterica subsp. enterica serovar Newport]EFG2587014.1 type II toxin-antitoxin system CcdA family antitoxin [Escherichia coli]
MSQSLRKSTNLTLDANLVAEARDMKINMSQAAEEGIAKAVAVEKARLWKEENREAIESWNRHFEEHGLPLAKFRQF